MKLGDLRDQARQGVDPVPPAPPTMTEQERAHRSRKLEEQRQMAIEVHDVLAAICESAKGQRCDERLRNEIAIRAKTEIHKWWVLTAYPLPDTWQDEVMVSVSQNNMDGTLHLPVALEELFQRAGVS